LSTATDKLDENMEWVYLRVRRAAKKCPNRNVFKRFKNSPHRHHHHRRLHHFHARKYVVPEFYEATCADVKRHLTYVHYITGWMHTSISRMMSPATVDPLYHSTFGKCRHFDNRKMRRRCRRIRMLRKALASPVVETRKEHFVSPLRDISSLGSGKGMSPYDAAPAAAHGKHSKMGKKERRRRMRHLRRSIRRLSRSIPKIGRTLAALQADVRRLSARLSGVTLPTTQPKIAGNNINNAKSHTDVSVGPQTPQAQTAANLAHMTQVINKLRSRLPKLTRKLGMMMYDISKVSRSLGGKRRHHRRGGRRHSRPHHHQRQSLE